MKFLIITKYRNFIVEAEDFEAASASAEWYEGHGVLAVILLEEYEEE